jgi:4-hydroxy-3-polyprenylbenzoate decarboxylase
MKKKKLILAISGASGSIYAIRMLEILKKYNEENDNQIEIHLIISKNAALTINIETDYKIEQLRSLADYNYNVNDMCASIASGSFKTDSMFIVPCSMKTLGSIAHSIEDNLIIRAAGVMLKENRKLILMIRETPMHIGYLENALKLAKLGAIISPSMPAFYNRPTSIMEIVDHSVSRMLDIIDIDVAMIKRWK